MVTNTRKTNPPSVAIGGLCGGRTSPAYCGWPVRGRPSSSAICICATQRTAQRVRYQLTLKSRRIAIQKLLSIWKINQLTNNFVVPLPPLSKFTHNTHYLLYQHYAPKYPLGLLAVPVPTWSTGNVPTTSTDCTNIVTPVSATLLTALWVLLTMPIL